MPKDKTATHNRLIPIMKEEFLTYGFDKASLQRIADRLGITAAGLYRHFPSKEAMFEYLVEPVMQEFARFYSSSMDDTQGKVPDENFSGDFSAFRTQKNMEALSFVYDHFDEMKLVIARSRGTKYEHFEEDLISMEVQSIKDVFSEMDRNGIAHKDVSDRQLHILCTTFIMSLTEAIKHDYTREEAFEHLEFIGRMLYPGIRDILGF